MPDTVTSPGTADVRLEPPARQHATAILLRQDSIRFGEDHLVKALRRAGLPPVDAYKIVVDVWDGHAEHRHGIAWRCYVRLPFPGLGSGRWRLQDLLGDARYERDGDDLQSRGLIWMWLPGSATPSR